MSLYLTLLHAIIVEKNPDTVKKILDIDRQLFKSALSESSLALSTINFKYMYDKDRLVNLLMELNMNEFNSTYQYPFSFLGTTNYATLFGRAIEFFNPEIIELLIERAAEEGINLLKEPCLLKHNIEYGNEKKDPLETAIYFINPQAVKYFLLKGITPKLKDSPNDDTYSAEDELRPLHNSNHYKITQKRPEDYEEVCSLVYCATYLEQYKTTNDKDLFVKACEQDLHRNYELVLSYLTKQAEALGKLINDNKGGKSAIEQHLNQFSKTMERFKDELKKLKSGENSKYKEIKNNLYKNLVTLDNAVDLAKEKNENDLTKDSEFLEKFHSNYQTKYNMFKPKPIENKTEKSEEKESKLELRNSQ